MKQVEYFRTDMMAYSKQERLRNKGISAQVKLVSFGKWLVEWEDE